MSRVSVISLETPVRRKQGERFDPVEVQKIVTLASSQRFACISTEHDCFSRRPALARTWSRQRAHSIPFTCRSTSTSTPRPERFSPGHAICWRTCTIPGACSAEDSRTFGRLPGLPSTICRDSVTAIQGGQDPEDFVGRLQEHDRFAVERMPWARTCFACVSGRNPTAFQQRLVKERVMLSAPQGDTFLVGVNETLNRTTANELAEKFIAALA